MSYNQPNYAKKKGGGVSVPQVVDIASKNLRVPVYEPILNDGILLLTVSGDLMIAEAYQVPLIVIEP